MKISILCPTFNRPDFIVKAVEAVLNQDYQDFEIIIKDGGEPIGHLLPKDDRIKYIWNKDRVITDAMNQAMKAATGDVFVWANDDDRISEGTLKFVSENLGKHKWGYGYIEMVKGDAGMLWGDEWSYQRLLKQNFVPQPSVYWKREVYEEMGEMDETNDLVSDYEYWLRIGSKYKPVFWNRIMAYYTIHKDQITQKIMAEQLRQANEVRKKYELLTR